MNSEEKARIVAFAKLLGVSGSNSEIFDKYWKYYQKALKDFKEENDKPEVIERLF